ncbi:transposase [Acetobacter malorum DSM 14337]|uniref:Transposase n=1 Tax=Acetobacter malorum DSM 14337 TaxID=1307910 RepID=A0ABQ0PQP5_9PROT|nr:transposase [Acetobacter malorum DSM 14337]
MLSGIIFVNRNGLHWSDASGKTPPHKNRWEGWITMGAFIRMMDGLAAGKVDPQMIMIDATYLKAHRKAFEPAVKKGRLAV